MRTEQRERLGDGLLDDRLACDFLRGDGTFDRGLHLGILAHLPRGIAGGGGEHRERNERQAGHQRQCGHQERDHAEGLGVAAELIAQSRAGLALDAALRDEQACGDRDDQRRNLADQTLADGEHGIGVEGLADRQTVRGDADGEANDDVDCGDQQRRDRVALHELRGTVHRAVEAALGLDLGASLARLLFADHAGGEIGVDRHLLAGHRVEAEAGRDFGDAPRALGDHDEVDDNQDHEDGEADDDLATHQELAERADHAARRAMALMAMRQDQASRGKVEAQPEHRCDQQDCREGAEFQRLFDE
jgi:hypothetical protein